MSRLAIPPISQRLEALPRNLPLDAIASSLVAGLLLAIGVGGGYFASRSGTLSLPLTNVQFIAQEAGRTSAACGVK